MTIDCGVYMIEHIASGKKYIGSAAKSISRRWSSHRSSLRNGKHKNSHLQRAWDKYGEDAFVFRIIEPCLPEHATGVEQVFIDYYKSTDPEFGYNNCPTAGSRFGSKASNETKAKQSTRMMGNKLSIGYKHTAESRAKNSLSHMGHKPSAEARAKIGAASKGRQHTAATRAKLSALMIGDKRNLGRKASATTRDKLSALMIGDKRNLGRKYTAETCAARSIFMKAVWARRKGIEL